MNDRKPSMTSDEVAANLLDQVQLTDDLFVEEQQTDDKAVEPKAQEPVILKMPEQEQVVKVTPQAEQPTPVKVTGFSALLDHLKAEAIRNNAAAQKHSSMRSAA